jgi:hypothetical protein
VEGEEVWGSIDESCRPKEYEYHEFARRLRLGWARGGYSCRRVSDDNLLYYSQNFSRLRDTNPYINNSGGSLGTVSYELATHHPNLKFIVQDRPELTHDFKTTAATYPSSVSSRVSFQPHDFWTPQPVRDADVYLFRAIMHDYSDEYAAKILRATVPAMKQGSRIIVVDTVVPPRDAMPNSVYRVVLGLDLQMMVNMNSLERTKEEWAELFAKTDERLVVKDVNQQPGVAFAVIEVVLSE